VLTLDVSEDWSQIIANGEPSDLEAAFRYMQAPRSEDTVRLPSSRLACMMLETIGQSDATPRYLALRRKVMRPTKGELQSVERKFKEELSGFVPDLLLHQWEFLAHHQNTLSAYNASEQGLGKTRMALAWLTMLGRISASRIIVVMPKDLAKQWEEELPSIWPDAVTRPRFVNATHGSKVGRRGAIHQSVSSQHWIDPRERFVIVAVNYEVIADLLESLDDFKPQVIIADEAWKIKNPRAQCTKAMIKLADLMRRRGGGFTLALAGTPIGNDIGDLWSQLRFLGRHITHLSYTAFLQRYAVLRPLRLPGRTVQVPVGVSDPFGLMALLEPCWFRATKASCLNLPPKVRREVRLKMSRGQRELYQSVERDGLASLGDDLSLAPQIVVNLRLQQIAGGHQPVLHTPPDQRDECSVEAEGTVGWATEPIEECPKIAWLKEWTETNLQAHPQTRVLIWCRFNSEVRRIATMLEGVLGAERVVMAIGGSSSDKLNRDKASFNSRHPTGVQVIVAQIARLAYGHNLSACDWNIYFSPTWSYIQHAQSEDRAHRIGRESDVNYIHLIAEGTIDEEAVAALKRKEDLSARFTPNIASPPQS
jgi:SNF2 family DNA or RNA helicase